MRFLIVTANFAPRGASPAIRTVHIVKYLSALGHDVSVVTYDTNTLTLFSSSDVELSKKVPETVVVERIKSGLIRRTLFKNGKNGSATTISVKKSSFKKNIAISLLVPDPHMESIPNFVRASCNVIERFSPDVILTFSYPFSMLWVGKILKHKYPSIKWIADYGDPWSMSPIAELPRPSWRKNLDRYLEKKWIRTADLVTLTSIPTKKLYEKEFPFLKNKTHVVPMGYDEDDIKNIEPISLPSELQDKIIFVHTGRVYPEVRDPKPFINALEKIEISFPKIFSKIKVVMVGESDNYVRGLVKNSSVERAFFFVDWVPSAESIAWMKSATWLLLFGNEGGLQVPGKVYQYLGVGGGIFMAQRDESDPTINIVKSAANYIVVENNSDAILNEIVNLVGDSKKINRAHAEGAQYSWLSIVSSLVDKLSSKLI